MGHFHPAGNVERLNPYGLSLDRHLRDTCLVHDRRHGESQWRRRGLWASDVGQVLDH